MQATPTAEEVAQHPNSLSSFLKIQFPPAEPLIKGLLNRREFCGFGGRRRHGKTTTLLGAGLALAMGKPEYLGYSIPKKRRFIGFFLEDDPAELQEKLKQMIGDNPLPDGFFVVPKTEFYESDIPISIVSPQFKEFVRQKCDETRPDVIVLDNLTHLVRADYNNPQKIDAVVQFVYQLQKNFNAAVIVAAHPRKRGNKAEDKAVVSLEHDPEGFFEEFMGCSHFVNSAGTLWGIERVRQQDKTIFVGGTQRRDGSQEITPLQMKDGWFVISDDFNEKLDLVLNTDKRRAAWNALPDNQPFTQADAERLTRRQFAHASFLAWWNALRQKEVILEASPGRFRKGHPSV